MENEEVLVMLDETGIANEKNLLKSFSNKASLTSVAHQEFSRMTFISLVLLLSRLAITIFCVTCLIYSGFHGDNGDAKWFIYLTNWSFLILNITFILLSGLSACELYRLWQDRSRDTKGDYGTFETSIETTRNREASVAEVHVVPKKDSFFKAVSSRWYHQVVWLLYNVSFCAGILVTIAYWSVVAEGTPNFLNVATHALNSVFILAEISLGRVPIRLLHSVYTMVYISAFIIFSVIYWKAGGSNPDGKPYIYKSLDYEGHSAGYIVGIVFSMFLFSPPVIQLFLFGLYKLRSRWFDPFNIA